MRLLHYKKKYMGHKRTTGKHNDTMRYCCPTSTDDIMHPLGPDQLTGSVRFLPVLCRQTGNGGTTVGMTRIS